MSIPPYTGETVSSYAWRLGRAYNMSLRQFARMGLGLSWSETVSDLDEIIPQRATEVLCSVGNIPVSQISQLMVPNRLRCSSWNSVSRKHNAQIFVCPECLSGEDAHACMSWRTKLAYACPTHRRWLVGSCHSCGEILRFTVDGFGAASVPWLDAWPVCAACGQAIERGDPVPEWLSYRAGVLEQFVEGRKAARIDVTLWIKLREIVDCRPELCRALSDALELPPHRNIKAAIAAILINAFDAQLHLQRSSESRELFLLFTGFDADSQSIIELLATAVAEACPLP